MVIVAEESSDHFHVLGGLRGCMPSVNDVYLDRAAAVRGMLFWREQELEGGVSSFDITGSAKEGWYDVGGNCPGRNEYYEITECDQAECLKDLDCQEAKL